MQTDLAQVAIGTNRHQHHRLLDANRPRLTVHSLGTSDDADRSLVQERAELAAHCRALGLSELRLLSITSTKLGANAVADRPRRQTEPARYT